MKGTNKNAGFMAYANLVVLKAAKRRKLKNPIPFYEKFFDDYHVEQYEKDVRMVLKNRQIEKIISSVNDGRIYLDVGCGVGHTLRRFPSGKFRIGIDYSQKSINIARNNLKDIVFCRASASDIPLANGSIDFITCFEVLEHLSDDTKAVREIARILRPGGLFFLSIPSTFYFKEYEYLMGHMRHYTRPQLDKLLNENGFTIIKNMNMFPRTQTLYFWIYIQLELYNIFLNKITGKKKTIYQREIPFTKIRYYETLITPFFLYISRLDNNKNRLKNSTFVLCQKAVV